MNPARVAPVGFVGGLFCLATAALVAGLTNRDGRWWEAAIHLAVLGGVLPVSYAVNHRIVPVFSRRKWQREQLWFVLVASSLAGGVLSAAGFRFDHDMLLQVGAVLGLVGGMLFTVQIGMLFRQEPAGPLPPLPFETQTAVDRIATRFSRLSGIYLLIGLLAGVATSFSVPDRGRWDLVWAHVLLLGCVVSMAASVTYHVLPRWSDGRWRTPRLIPVHFALSLIATPAMIVALATDQSWLFRIGGPLQAVALLLWGINCAPLMLRLPQPTRLAWFIAFGFLAMGVSLGAAFAIREKFGPIYRQVHAEFNLFGWAGMLILGAAYYLVPRFAGSAMVWPRLVNLQIPALAAAIFAGGIVRRLQNGGRGDFQTAIELSHVGIALVLASFAVQIAFTFRAKPSAPVLLIPVRQTKKTPEGSLPLRSSG